MGVNVNFSGGHPRDIERIAAAGFRVVRADLLWADIETEYGRYDWRGSDELVRDLRENHLVPLLILAYSNRLYAPRVFGRPGSPSLAYAVPDRGRARAAFMAFVRAAARRYGTSVIWEVWNEPDQNFGTPINLHSYVNFAQEACHQLRGIAPDATVIGPAASGFEWSFLQDFVAANRSQCFDAISIHPYRDEAPESVLGEWARARGSLAPCTTPGPCIQLIDGEWGYSVTGREWNARRQADFDVRIRLLDVMAGIPLTVFYDWRNDGPNPADKEANFGLLDFHGSPKPAFHALDHMVQALRGLHYMGQVATKRPEDFLLAFGADGEVRKLVGWTAGKRDSEVELAAPVCVDATIAGGDQPDTASCGPRKFELHAQGTLPLTAAPAAFPLTPGPDGVPHVQIAQQRHSD
ncbi:MAG TPA: hypothetical protein VHO91_09565 [Rhodopila sp.]|nr:hypothetical protein [Rhodopila sp.]